MLKSITIIVFASSVLGQGAIPDERCPIVNQRPPVLIPHEQDCTLYYICHFGNRILMPSCPRGLKFDTRSSRCILAGEAKCGNGSEPIHPTVPQETTLAAVETTISTESSTSTDTTASTTLASTVSGKYF